MPRPRQSFVTSKSWRWVAAAAVVVILIGVGYVIRPITIQAPYGELAEAKLPDGSSVQLNSGSTLTYRAQFFGSRAVSLDGEAYFDVVKDDREFVVETPNALTTVLGTEFNVRSRSDEGLPVTSVAVASGRVKVAARDDLRSVILESGEGSIVKASDDPTPPSEIVVRRELAWRHGGLAFSDQPFNVIFAEVERRFDVEISASADLAAQSYSLYVNKPASAESVLGTLAQARGLKYRETATGFEVYRP